MKYSIVEISNEICKIVMRYPELEYHSVDAILDRKNPTHMQRSLLLIRYEHYVYFMLNMVFCLKGGYKRKKYREIIRDYFSNHYSHIEENRKESFGCEFYPKKFISYILSLSSKYQKF